MKMDKLPIKTINIVPPDEVVSSGAFRQRRVTVGMPYSVSVVWELNETEAFYLSKFFAFLFNGATPFEVDLPSVAPVEELDFYETYTAFFNPGTFRKTLVNYKKYTISAVLSVENIVTFEDIERGLINATSSFEYEAHIEFLNLFNNFVNIEIPDRLET